MSFENGDVVHLKVLTMGVTQDGLIVGRTEFLYVGKSPLHDQLSVVMHPEGNTVVVRTEDLEFIRSKSWKK